MKIEGKCRVTKCPGNGRVFSVTGDTLIEVGKEMLVGNTILTSEVESIESSSDGLQHAKNHFVVKTVNSTYIVEKL